jgi:hypothetical protein
MADIKTDSKSPASPVDAAHADATSTAAYEELSIARERLDAFVLSLATTGESGGRFSTIRNIRNNVKDEHVDAITLAQALTGDSNVKKVADLALALHSANRVHRRKGQ